VARILAFSDVHCDAHACATLVTEGAKADLVIGAGDFAQRREGLADTMGLLAPLAPLAIYVAGNNENPEELAEATTAPVLQGTSLTCGALVVAGIGCAVPPLPPMPWGSVDLSEDAARALLDRVEHCDILISHSPPKGVADVHADMGSIGSVAVREVAERLQPKLLFCGHVHDCWGQEGQIGATRVVNLGPTPNWFEV